ncbi:inositol 1,4,5-trisphosphate receptor type 3-like, partial [Notothenia coriiceps]|uniref:Inositol 1,4,5-trisphosphate receptor type 3-like n=1 Tax=Notothenia coriiceps TaxID=8208 RepID=A0A6I9PBP7_9TELE
KLLMFDGFSSAKSRSIALPLDLESQISSMLSSSALNSLSRSNPNYKSSSRSSRPVAPSNPWDYKNIIEKLQDMKEECQKYGSVVSLLIPKENPGKGQTLDHLNAL